MKKIVTNSNHETGAIGARLWEKYKKYAGKKAVVFGLEGELGAGKTQLVKGLAKKMEILDDVISPTFTLEAEYDLGKLVHIDAWRLEDPQELLEIGFKERIERKQVIIIEWADQVREVIGKMSADAVVVWVKLEYGKDVNERIIYIDPALNAGE